MQRGKRTLFHASLSLQGQLLRQVMSKSSHTLASATSFLPNSHWPARENRSKVLKCFLPDHIRVADTVLALSSTRLSILPSCLSSSESHNRCSRDTLLLPRSFRTGLQLWPNEANPASWGSSLDRAHYKVFGRSRLAMATWFKISQPTFGIQRRKLQKKQAVFVRLHSNPWSVKGKSIRFIYWIHS